MSKTLRAILISVPATALLILLIFNFSPGQSRLEYVIEPLYSLESPEFRRSLDSLLGSPLLPGNAVTALQNGEEIFPSMLEAIRSAQKTISFEIYIYWKGEIGRQFTQALCERARAGVAIHVLVDWIGSAEIDKEFIEELRAAGVQIEFYRPLRWYNLDRINNRTHRRLLVVDGKIGFTGGVGVADHWTGHAQDPDHWRDSHYRIEGPAVAHLQSAFMLNWNKVSPRLLHGNDYFPELSVQGPSRAQMFTSSAGADDETVRLMYLLVIASAQRSVRIANAYFVPDPLAIKQILDARKRNVTVEIMVPGSGTDVPLTRYASRGLWESLLKAGVKIYEFQPTMMHTKLMVVDDVFVSVGSTNFDNRSFQLNDEANLNVIDPAFGREQAAQFAADQARSKAITLELWNERPLYEKVLERIALLFKSQL